MTLKLFMKLGMLKVLKPIKPSFIQSNKLEFLIINATIDHTTDTQGYLYDCGLINIYFMHIYIFN